jgi:hypothetical protein
MAILLAGVAVATVAVAKGSGYTVMVGWVFRAFTAICVGNIRRSLELHLVELVELVSLVPLPLVHNGSA